MQILVELPDDLASRAQPARDALEAVAIAGYRSRAFTPYQVQQSLGFEI